MTNPGSSPLARGTRSAKTRDGRQPRLIPARAGNTKISPSGFSYMTAHPRSRGEHLVKESMTARVSGSSPLARGTHVAKPISVTGGRLIPARAGNTGQPEHRALCN